jgi:hypothetical protein
MIMSAKASTRSAKAALSQPLTLYAADARPITIGPADLSLILRGQRLHSCRLRGEISYADYQQVEAGGWLHLDPLVRGAAEAEFTPEAPVRLTMQLQPDLLARLAHWIHAPSGAVRYLEQLGDPGDPLLSAEQWFATAADQLQGGRWRGYTTFWSHLDVSAATPARLASGDVVASLLAFSRTRPDLAPAVEPDADAIQELIGAAISELFAEEVGAALDEDPAAQPDGDDLYATLLEFLRAENWPYVRLEDEQSIQIAVQGQNGAWSCTAHIRDPDRQCIIYSWCATPAPAARRMAMAEFLTRLNVGLIIGNFELDLDSGIVRYKTSLDVEGDRLSQALLRQLIYANINTMDSYLPDLLALIAGTATPLEVLGRAAHHH